ncbi:ectoine/hydroxyectoine ABC transporter permease subunit EhuC [Saccharomonospora sp. NPDC046836]|uniref:ectoine/hydroxyectoine ABC transporter permease subunit EhuC n=1 Tax=Saccharomonospora sp. NPDC046836 TaxID=3156921 RepID=UPI00340CF89D
MVTSLAPQQIGEYLRLLSSGIQVTITLTVVSGLLCIVVAVVAGVARLSNWRVIRTSAGIFIEFFRGTNAIVQLFWAFYSLPLLGIYLSPMSAAIIVLSLNAGAYGAEIVRGAIQAVPLGQREASMALNMKSTTMITRVILPQAYPAMVPPFTNLLIELLKTTPLVSLITISDMTFVGDTIRTRTGDNDTVFILLFVLYFALAICIAALGRMLERIPKYRRTPSTSRRQARVKHDLEVAP